jgi:glycosyltransferase involved in cell wall biosynthesis
MTVIHVIEPFASGVTTAIINITQKLPEVEHIVVHGSRMWVDSIENVRSKFPEGVRFIPWNHAGREISPVHDFRALLLLIKILRPYRKKAVIHLHSSKAGFIGRLACRMLGIKRVLYTPHCAAFIRTDISEKKRNFYRFLEKWAGKMGGLVVGCGESEAQLYADLGLPAKAVPNGVDMSSPAPVAPKKERIVVFVGIANEQKNPAMFNAIAKEFGSDPSARFIWVGDGALRGELDEERIEVTGWKEKDEVLAFLDRSLIYLSTSGWEGLPFGVLEAMRASCALLLHDVPGNRDLVDEGKNGHLFSTAGQAADLLGKMLADTGRTNSMGRESRRMAAEGFSAEKMAEGYRLIYQSFR